MNAALLFLRKTKWAWSVLITGIALAYVATHRQTPTPLPEKDQRALDSMTIARPLFDLMQQLSAKRETVFVHHVDTLTVHAKQLTETALGIGRDADAEAAAAQQARSADSALAHLQVAYTARTNEVTLLLHVVDTLTNAVAAANSARRLADARADSAVHRAAFLDTLNGRIARDAKRATECSFLWMKCPSRVAGDLVSAAGGYALAKFGR